MIFSELEYFRSPPIINTRASKIFILFLRVLLSHFKSYFYFGSTKCLHSRLIGIRQKAAARIMARNLRFGSTSEPSLTASVGLPEADQFGERPVC